MTASPNPCGPPLAQWSANHLPDPLRVGVAFSGGADSTALLLAALSRWPGRVVALHVNHGLQVAAEAFERHVSGFCEANGLRLLSIRVNAANASGQSPEDAARQARYQALADLARTAELDVILLGQHADDQAETLLLALSRGAGLPGLAAMPERFERHGVVFGRPLLSLPSQSLRDWLTESGVAFVDDPSNADLRLTRNRIRSVLLPAWQVSFPGFRQALARSARHAAQAQRLLDDLALADLAQVGEPPDIQALQGMGTARQANLLRCWLKRESGRAPSEAQLHELLGQVAACQTRGHGISIKVGEGFVRRSGAVLRYDPPI